MSAGLKLLATYGVTEACVYQTAGEVFCPSVYNQPSREDDIPRHSPGNDYQKLIGQDVGTAFLGTKIRICKEPHDLSSTSLDINSSKLMDVDPSLKHECGLFGVGEVVLSGCQLDEYSSYLNLPQLSSEKFVHVMTPCDVQTAAVIPDHSMMDCPRIEHSNQPNYATPDMLSPYQSVEYFYRTGDRACLDSSSGHLRILGRINGEEGMIKFNGVRIELGEIENAIQDPLVEDKSKRGYSVVERCIVVSRPKIDEDNQRYLWAYCVLSTQVLHELGLTSSSFESSDSNVVRGILCTPSSPLLTLLRNRCRLRVRMGITPAKFIILSTIPMTPTGKCNYKALPDFFELLSNVSVQAHDSCNLTNYGRCGKALADEITSCLNIQSYHMSLMTTDASFAMLGGDSLAATRVVKSRLFIVVSLFHFDVVNLRVFLQVIFSF
jgi:acyl-CoA synthetase (AMP-forming)/AMP-acid ligase II